MWSIEWCHFQWPWVTPNSDFKGMPCLCGLLNNVVASGNDLSLMSFQLYCLKISVGNSGDVANDDIAYDLEWLEGHFRHNKRFYCLYLKIIAYVMYKVNYNSRRSCVSNCLCCRIWPEWPNCDAERDLLVLAKFIVHIRIVALLYAVSF